MNMDVVMAQTKPKKEPTTRYYGLKLHKEKDADLIQFLDEYKNKQGIIKAILRAWISHIKRIQAGETNDKT